MRKLPFYPLLIAIFFAVSCSTSYKTENVQYSHYRIQQFDEGSRSLTSMVKPYSDSAKFPMLVSNYDFTGTPMEYKYEPYKIFKRGKIKIGVFGLGVEMAGLVPGNLSAGTKYLDPVTKGNGMAYKLKKEKNCDLIICLSHLGYQYSDNKVSDKRLANETENIDLIVGGHTHTFLNAPVVFKNKKGDDVIVNQVRLGRN